ncbi:type II toxin-antitoxin system VapC family toxin [Candidatus Poribacteria bacterium]
MGLVADFRRTILQYQCVFLDSALMIYHLEDIKPYSMLTTEVFTALAQGTLEAVLSTISITELLKKPFKEGRDNQIAVFEMFISSLPQTRLIVPTYTIAKQAARLRGQYGLRTPDAILFSTAQTEGCDAFLTNDIRLKKLEAEGVAVVVLSEFTDS